MDTSTTQEAMSLNSSIPAELELYTIPSSSGWFDWNGIHEIERAALKEFFDSSSYTRTPKVYREYRDFIINKFREEPTRRLTFTEIRKALVGDVSLLRKVFGFLERWGLINFGLESSGGGEVGLNNGEGKVEVKVEEGAPVGVRVVAVPGSGKPLSDPVVMGSSVGLVDGGVRFPPLASYSDVFGDLVKPEVVVCVSCGDKCGSGHYKSKKKIEYSNRADYSISFSRIESARVFAPQPGREAICKKCYESKSFGEGNSVDDFEPDDSNGIVWTDEETLLLLESVVKHGDDWELIAQTVKTKSKVDCIAKLITLPLGDFQLGSDHGLINLGNNDECSVKDVQTPLSKPDETVKAQGITDEAATLLQSSKPDETVKTEDITHELIKSMQNGDNDFEGPPMKKKCIDRSSIMEQVAVISSMVSPHITAAAAEAAVAALCDENPDLKEVFDTDEEDYMISGSGEATQTHKRTRLEVEDSEMKDSQFVSTTCKTSHESSVIPIALRYRAATATALGAAAARAKLLADQEDRELEYLMAIIIENQLKKLSCKMKVLVDVQRAMETESALIAEQEESIISERIDILKKALDLGITRLRDNTSVKSESNVVL
ncbi:unnamed protein product [Rhodiola kirilowii]